MAETTRSELASTRQLADQFRLMVDIEHQLQIVAHTQQQQQRFQPRS